MPRSFHLFAAVLGALTAVALLGAVAAIRPPGQPAAMDDPNEALNRARTLAFYDAINMVIATGDLAPLTTLVAPEVAPGIQNPGLSDGSRLKAD